MSMFPGNVDPEAIHRFEVCLTVREVMGYFAEKANRGLADSIHAPKNMSNEPKGEELMQQPLSTVTSPFEALSPAELRHRILWKNYHNLRIRFPEQSHLFKPPPAFPDESFDDMSPVANVDDTSAFMKAARARRLEQTSGSKGSKAASEQGSTAAEAADAMKLASGGTVSDLVHEWADVGTAAKDDSVPHGLEQVNTKAEAEVKTETTEKVFGGSANETASFTADAKSVTVAPTVETKQENREVLSHFKSWGLPETRNKAPAQVRRIILRGFPSSWSVPAKLLTHIHGGAIENIFIAANGNAHVIFVEHEACKAFFDRYPNGIDLDKEKRTVAFVEMGTDVDVLSSQLEYNLTCGATRVVRAVGVDMHVTMGQVLKLAHANGRKVEKILDSYVPGDARNVVVRFCSIDDAVKFKSAIIREPDWEHWNIQYAQDPCEVATGFHAD